MQVFLMKKKKQLSVNKTFLGAIIATEH